MFCTAIVMSNTRHGMIVPISAGGLKYVLQRSITTLKRQPQQISVLQGDERLSNWPEDCPSCHYCCPYFCHTKITGSWPCAAAARRILEKNILAAQLGCAADQNYEQKSFADRWCTPSWLKQSSGVLESRGSSSQYCASILHPQILSAVREEQQSHRVASPIARAFYTQT